MIANSPIIRCGGLCMKSLIFEDSSDSDEEEINSTGKKGWRWMQEKKVNSESDWTGLILLDS